MVRHPTAVFHSSVQLARLLKTCSCVHLPICSVDYNSGDGITAEGEEEILLALGLRHHVRQIRLIFPVQNLRELVMPINENFPILEYLVLQLWVADSAALILSETLQAQNLHHLMLRCFTCPIRPQLHPTATGLTTLYLTVNHPFAYFQPNILPQFISFMPQLKSLVILFTQGV